jgi:hypothetical protein
MTKPEKIEATSAPEWLFEATYEPGAKVTYKKAEYVALAQTTAHAPDASPTSWVKIAPPRKKPKLDFPPRSVYVANEAWDCFQEICDRKKVKASEVIRNLIDSYNRENKR